MTALKEGAGLAEAADGSAEQIAMAAVASMGTVGCVSPAQSNAESRWSQQMHGRAGSVQLVQHFHGCNPAQHLREGLADLVLAALSPLLLGAPYQKLYLHAPRATPARATGLLACDCACGPRRG